MISRRHFMLSDIELAPYIGVHWVRRFGETADLAADDSETRFVAGVRVWF